MKTQNIKDLRHLIRYAKGRNLKSYSYSSLYHCVASILDGSHIQYYKTVIPDDKDNFITPEHVYGCFRTRKVKTIEEIQFEHHLWAPPAEYNKIYGRCSEPNQKKILYCSNNLIVTFAELGLRDGDICVTARFAEELNQNENVFTVAIGKERAFFEDNPKYNPSGDRLDKILSPKKLKKQLIIEDFIHKAFVKKVYEAHHYKYKLTAAISRFYLDEQRNKGIEIAGILYPSVKANLNSFNLAFYEETAKKLLKISWIRAIKIKKVENERYTFDYLGQVNSIDENGRLSWLLNK